MKNMILAVLACAAPLSLWAGIAEKMSQRAGELKGLYAEFEQVREISLLEEKAVSKGFLVFDDSDGIRWQTNEPFKAAMISRGGKVSQFEFEDGRWKRLKFDPGFPIGKILGEIRAVAAGDLAGRERAYDSSESGGALVLTPAHEAARQFVSRITVKPRPDFSSPESIRIDFPGGDSTTITFGRTVANPPDAARAFETDPVSDYPAK